VIAILVDGWMASASALVQLSSALLFAGWDFDTRDWSKMPCWGFCWYLLYVHFYDLNASERKQMYPSYSGLVLVCFGAVSWCSGVGRKAIAPSFFFLSLSLSFV
jgi:hypothetical protein